jgi:hypothetical protein
MVNDTKTVKKPERADFLFMPKGFWVQPTKSLEKKGDAADKANEMYAAVGRAMTAWEETEDRLAALYTQICEVEINSVGAVLRTFGSIEASGGRLKAIMTMLEVYLVDYLHFHEVAWKMDEFKKDVTAAQQRRNEIAHGRVVYIIGAPLNAEGKPAWSPIGHYLIAPNYMTGRNVIAVTAEKVANDPAWIISSTYCYVTSEIEEMRVKFLQLGIRIGTFMSELAKGPGKVPRFVLPILEAHEANAREKELRAHDRRGDWRAP